MTDDVHCKLNCTGPESRSRRINSCFWSAGVCLFGGHNSSWLDRSPGGIQRVQKQHVSLLPIDLNCTLGYLILIGHYYITLLTYVNVTWILTSLLSSDASLLSPRRLDRPSLLLLLLLMVGISLSKNKSSAQNKKSHYILTLLKPCGIMVKLSPLLLLLWPSSSLIGEVTSRLQIPSL